jgi:hypothetical protein
VRFPYDSFERSIQIGSGNTRDQMGLKWHGASRQIYIFLWKGVDLVTEVAIDSALTTLPPGKEPAVPSGKEAEWTSEPVWTIWRTENC